MENPVTVGLVESLDLVARRDRDGECLEISKGLGIGLSDMGRLALGAGTQCKEALQTMFETGLPAIIYEELTGDEYKPVDGMRHVR